MDAPASPCSSGEGDDSIWGDVSADSGIACIEGRGDQDAADDGDSDGGSSSAFLFARIHRTIDENGTLDQLKQAIEACAKGSDERRAEAVNFTKRARVRVRRRVYEDRDESPLLRAHLRRRGDMVALLLLSGASPRSAFGATLNAVAVAAAYGQLDCLRSLLRAHPEQANERLRASTVTVFRGGTALHAALTGPRLAFGGYAMSPLTYVQCAEVLMTEGGADASALDADSRPPIFLLEHSYESHLRAALDALVRRGGADVNARDAQGKTFLFHYVRGNYGARARMLIEEYGASADVVAASDGTTPLLAACAWRSYSYSYGFGYNYGYGAHQPDKTMVEALLRASSDQTRRAVQRGDGQSAADLLLSAVRDMTTPAVPGAAVPGPAATGWQRRAIAELVASGAPVLPQNQELAQQIVASVAADAAAAAAAAPAPAPAPAAEQS